MSSDAYSAIPHKGSRSGELRFSKYVSNTGRFHLRPLIIPEDIPLVHSWVTLPYARFWGMEGFTEQQVETGYLEIARHADVFVGYCDDTPVFLMESYHPSHDPVGEHYDVEPGDRGMHILVAPAKRPVRDFTWSVFRVVMDFLFDDPAAQRIVVEPDIRNEKIHALNRRAGFEYQKIIQLGPKTAHLAFCTRAQYASALKHSMNTHKGI